MDRMHGATGLDDLGYPLRTGHDPLNAHRYDPTCPISVDTQRLWAAPDQDIAPSGWDPAEELAEMLAGAARAQPLAGPLDDGPSRRRNRRRPHADPHPVDGGRRVTHVTVLVAAITVSSVSMLGWSVAYSYDQLRAVASSVLPGQMALWWPLTVFGPWFVAALSILRATLQHRSAARSWGVILAASALAMALCVAPASHALLPPVVIGIPPVTALVCFWELVGQVPPPVRPRHAAPAHGAAKLRRAHGVH